MGKGKVKTVSLRLRPDDQEKIDVIKEKTGLGFTSEIIRTSITHFYNKLTEVKK